MILEITKNQAKDAMEQLIKELTTEQFAVMIRALIRQYACWCGADVRYLLRGFPR
jgi:hypothetical protein